MLPALKRVFSYQFTAIRTSIYYFLIITLLLITYHVSLITPVHAQQAPASGSVGTADYTAFVHTGFTLTNLLNNLAGCWIGGVSLSALKDVTTGTTPSGGDKCGLVENGQLQAYYVVPGGGALGGIGRTMVAMYQNPPTSTTQYLADLGTNIGIVKPAYAQGVGGSGEGVLLPILNLWKVMRNMAYLVFIFVFIAVGFMIMFRRKLNPQTVVSVQSALPGLVIGLILVTFSYFLAALIIDLSFVSMKLVAFTFQQSNAPNIIAEGHCVPGVSSTPIGGGLGCTEGAESLAEKGNIFSLYWSFIANDSLRSNVVAPLTDYFNVQHILPGILSDEASQNCSGIFCILSSVTGAAGSALGLIVGGLAGVLIGAIIMIALLIQMIRLLWALISAYITILVFSVVGPLLIAVGSIPGRGSAISFWWKTLLGNVMIFPAIFFAFLFAGMFLANAGAGTANISLPFFAGIQVPIINAIIGYGIVLGSPAIPGMVKQALGVKDIGAIQQAAFGGITAGFAPFSKGASKMYEPYRRRTEAAKEAILRERYTSPEGQKAISQAGGLQRFSNIIGGLPSPNVRPQGEATPVNPTRRQ